MSTPEHVQPEAKSSFKVTLNAKREPQFEIKVVAGESVQECDRLRGICVAQFRALKQELGIA